MKGCLAKGLVVSIITGVCIAIAYFFITKESPLPIFSPSQVNPLLVDESVRENKNHHIAGFEFMDQEGRLTDSSFTKGNIHVADFFFTTCQTICPIMSGKMSEVQSTFEDEDRVRFLSFSVLPEQDSVPALHAYAQAYGVPYKQWRLLTGDKADIYELARKSYFTLKPAETGQGDGGFGDFIHTNNFVLVDGDSRIRGYYNGTSDRDMERLEKDIRSLLKELNRPE